MKRPSLLALIAVGALLCALPMLANATDSCLVALWAGPMGPEDMQGHVEVTFYTIHSWYECDCMHNAGTIRLKWQYVGDSWSNWLNMSTFGIDLCELTCYDLSFTVNHGSTVNVYVEDTAKPDDCHFGVAAWRVP